MNAWGYKSAGTCDKTNVGPEEIGDSGGGLETKSPWEQKPTDGRTVPEGTRHLQVFDCKLSWERSWGFSFFQTSSKFF